MMKWEILSSDYLLKSKWLTVRKDYVRMPSGIEMDDYYVLEYPDWINVIAITEDGKFVIERQYRHGTQSVDYELCAGTIEDGETPQEALAREIREELEAEITVGEHLITVETDYPEFHLSMQCFWAELKEGSHINLVEHEAAKWLSSGELDSVSWLPADVKVVEAIRSSDYFQ